MDKNLILEKYKNPEEKLLISKFFDKIEIASKTNKIQTTDFLNESEQAILQKVINIIKFENYEYFGGVDNCERKLIIVYPEKMKDIFVNKNFKYDTLISVFRILIPKIEQDNFKHNVYLGGIIKLGIKREKIGDIIVYKNGADIIVKKETEKFLFSNLKTLTRFNNSEISNIKINDITKIEKHFEDIKIITSSLRLDNIISELAKTSRNKATEILLQERVFINYQNETKNTKLVKEKDVISIRGKGKFFIDEIVGNTKKGNFIINVKKYV
ncbi:MAG: hypothetical protein J6A89_01115 [Clostridia bacterium]|nr:hypothetical protein [Clostridia bacterium]